MEDHIKSPGNSIQGQGSSNYKSLSLKIGNWVYPDELRKNVIQSAGWSASHFLCRKVVYVCGQLLGLYNYHGFGAFLLMVLNSLL